MNRPLLLFDAKKLIWLNWDAKKPNPFVIRGKSHKSAIRRRLSPRETSNVNQKRKYLVYLEFQFASEDM